MPAYVATLVDVYGSAMGGSMPFGYAEDIGIPLFGSTMGGAMAMGEGLDGGVLLYGSAMGGALSDGEAGSQTAPTVFDIDLLGGYALCGSMAYGRFFLDIIEAPIYFFEAQAQDGGSISSSFSEGGAGEGQAQ